MLTSEAKRDPKTELLRTVPGLRTTPDHRLASLLPLVDTISFAPGSTLVREGTRAKEVFVIVDGTADVLVGGRCHATVGRGDYVGEIAALDHGCHTASVVAVTQVRALVMDPRGFAGIMREPLVAAKLAAQLAQRLRGATTAAS
jgi:CRP-like cAMP-binding protein